MDEELDAARVKQVTRLLREVTAAIDEPGGIRHDARTAAVLAETLIGMLDGLRDEVLDVEIDRLVAVRNLSRNLDDRAGRVRASLAALVVRIMDSRPDLLTRDGSSSTGAATPSGMVALDLVRDLARDFPSSGARDPSTGRARSGRVVAHRVQRTYRPYDAAGAVDADDPDRIEFESAEAAETAGYRPGTD